MGGDHTRLTFDPAKGFSGVHKQQGRVTLDADFNEFEEILDRRGRATAYDTLGQAVYPSSTTPDGFRIGTAADGGLTIGPGRMYVDGILVECFGPSPEAGSPPGTPLAPYDAHLGGTRGAEPLPYGQQPFAYGPAYPVPSGTAGDVSLVYLDVWQREVTVYEDDGLREPALGGADTASRVQTAWQVKSVPQADDWDTRTAPSTGRLTTGSKPVAAEPGPCVITPAEGYTGLENRLYRVEVCRTGTLAGDAGNRALFRWSRDNASLGAHVLAVRQLAAPSSTGARSVVTVDCTGRDAWLRFEVGDHLELLDDQVEYACRESGTLGGMARVVEVKHATGEIHVDQDLSGFPVDAEKHPRLRRWDVATPGDAAVREVRAGVALDLEAGITVTFSGTEGVTDVGTLRAGDFWVFSARTADGTVEPLRKAPPRGILHHFAKLANVTTGQPEETVDLRVPWPSPGGHGQGCCTVVVHPGEDIQQAIDLLESMGGSSGGCVCLTAGEHRVTEQLRIRRGNVTLHGEAPWVTVRKSGDTPLVLDIASADGELRNVTVQGISFLASATDSADPMLRLSGVTGGRIAECALTLTGVRPGSQAGTTGVVLDRVTGYAVESCVLTGLPNGIAGSDCEGITVTDTTLNGPSDASREQPLGAISYGALGVGFVGADTFPDVAGMRIERNDISHYRRGIQLGAVADGRNGRGGGQGADPGVTRDGCWIIANNVTRAGDDRLSLGGAVLYFAFAAHVARCEITDNTAVMVVPADCGVIADGRDALIARNRLFSRAELNEGTLPDTLPLGVVAYVPRGASMDCTVRGNLFRGLQQAVRVGGGPQPGVNGGERPVRGAPHRAEVLENHVVAPDELPAPPSDAELADIVAFFLKGAAIVVDGVPRTRIAENDIVHSVLGVLSRGAVGGALTGNRLSHVLVGAVWVAAQQSAVTGNRVEDASVVGLVLAAGEENLVAHNVVCDARWGIACVSGTSTRLLDNAVHRLDTGVGLAFETDAEVRGNLVEDAWLDGIVSVLALHGVTLARNHTRRCGRANSSNQPRPVRVRRGIGVYGSGISSLGTLGAVTIDSCQVVDTGAGGEPAEEFVDPVRYGILVFAAGSARVSGCEVSIRPLPDSRGVPDTRSRALRVSTTARKVIGGTPEEPEVVEQLPFADVTDNLFEQAAGGLVEIAVGTLRGERETPDEENQIRSGEVMFAMNRCVNLASRIPERVATVQLNGAFVTITGNRIEGAAEQSSLKVSARILSAVGNIVRFEPEISVSSSEVPAPFESFNNVL